MEKENVKNSRRKNRDVRDLYDLSTIPKIGKGRVLPRKVSVEKPLVRNSEFYTPTIEEWGEEISNQPIVPAYIDQILPSQPGEGILIAGRTGAGKTNLSLYMSYCLATGHDFYGYGCKKVNVAYFAYEGGSTNYLDRKEKIKKLFSPDAGDNIRFYRISTRSAADMYRETMIRLDEIRHCKVVIFDGARHVIHGDPSKGSYAENFLTQLQYNLNELDMCAVLTLQVKKPNKDSLIHPGDIYSIKGAVEIAAWATTSILLEKQMRKRNDATIYFDKNRIATMGDLEPIDVRFNHDRCCFELADDDIDI